MGWSEGAKTGKKTGNGNPEEHFFSSRVARRHVVLLLLAWMLLLGTQ
jgi:hypothetical protein